MKDFALRLMLFSQLSLKFYVLPFSELKIPVISITELMIPIPICRSVFTVEDPVLLVPKLSSGLNTAFLRVIDNDTGEEVPKVFMRVAPYNYARNQVK